VRKGGGRRKEGREWGREEGRKEGKREEQSEREERNVKTASFLRSCNTIILYMWELFY
jgi:hypothetical protein